MAGIQTIEGIGPTYRRKLVATGVKTTQGLLRRAGTRKGRNEIARATGIDASRILEWCNRADLMRVKGVGEEYSDLLENTGVDTCRELARRNADNLHAAMLAVNKKRKRTLVRRPPSLKEVRRWIAHARRLKPAIKY